MTTATAERISFELEHGGDCAKLGEPLLEQLSTGRYDRCSVLEIPESLDDWLAEHRTARKRASRCLRRGYKVGPLARERHVDEIVAINRSAPVRQGRPMSAGYLERPTFSPLVFSCPRHAIRTLGVWSPDEVLVGYIAIYRCGELALVSQILGHAAHLRDEIMYPLFAAALNWEIQSGPGVVVYNRHDSGTDGLRFYKERLGFHEEEIEWAR